MSAPQYGLVSIEDLTEQAEEEGNIEFFLELLLMQNVINYESEETQTVLQQLYQAGVDKIFQKHVAAQAGYSQNIPAPLISNSDTAGTLALAYRKYAIEPNIVSKIVSSNQNNKIKKTINVGANADFNVYKKEDAHSGNFIFDDTKVVPFYNQNLPTTFVFDKKQNGQNFKIRPVISDSYKSAFNVSYNYNYELPFTINTAEDSLDFSINSFVLPTNIRFVGTIVENRQGNTGKKLIVPFFGFFDANNESVSAFDGAHFTISVIVNDKSFECYSSLARNKQLNKSDPLAFSYRSGNLHSMQILLSDIQEKTGINVNRTHKMQFRINFPKLPPIYQNQYIDYILQTDVNVTGQIQNFDEEEHLTIQVSNPWLPNTLDEARLVTVNESILESIKEQKQLYFLRIVEIGPGEGYVNYLGNFFINPVGSDGALQRTLEPGVNSEIDAATNTITVMKEDIVRLNGVRNTSGIPTFYVKLGSFPLSQYYYHKLNDIPFYVRNNRLYNPLSEEHPFTVETSTHTSVIDFKFLFDYSAYFDSVSFRQGVSEGVTQITNPPGININVACIPRYYIDLDEIKENNGLRFQRFTAVSFVSNYEIVSIDVVSISVAYDDIINENIQKPYVLDFPIGKKSVLFFDWDIPNNGVKNKEDLLTAGTEIDIVRKLTYDFNVTIRNADGNLETISSNNKVVKWYI